MRPPLYSIEDTAAPAPATVPLILPPPALPPMNALAVATSCWAIFGTLTTVSALLSIQAILMASYWEALGFLLISAASQVLIYVVWLKTFGDYQDATEE